MKRKTTPSVILGTPQSSACSGQVFSGAGTSEPPPQLLAPCQAEAGPRRQKRYGGAEDQVRSVLAASKDLGLPQVLVYLSIYPGNPFWALFLTDSQLPSWVNHGKLNWAIYQTVAKNSHKTKQAAVPALTPSRVYRSNNPGACWLPYLGLCTWEVDQYSWRQNDHGIAFRVVRESLHRLVFLLVMPGSSDQLINHHGK